MKKARVYRNCVVHHTPLDLSPVMSAVALPQGDYPCRLELRLRSNPEARDPTKFDSHGPSGVDGVLYCRDLLLNAAELTDQLAAWVLNHRESPQRGAPS
jgi:hypothetical protein